MLHDIDIVERFENRFILLACGLLMQLTSA